jgi:hypothetical protein
LSPKSCSSLWSDSGDQGLDLEVLTRGCCSSREAQVTPVGPVPLTGLTGATPVGFSLAERLGVFAVVLCCSGFEFGSVWSSVGLFGVLGLSG